MAKRYTAKISLPLTPETRGDLEAVSERFNIPVSEVVRECIESDLPRLIERYKKRNSETKILLFNSICTIGKRGLPWICENINEKRKMLPGCRDSFQHQFPSLTHPKQKGQASNQLTAWQYAKHTPTDWIGSA